ncbi:skin secretory protein xP2 isoform X2 [Rhinolophus ferrumequinum]|uniref:skin secretory protein xP2 isoform X2 n=1 Tax=Rhinolophus ferrumequinum TaxID=59479 RepID=UPI00140F5EF5|nr:skin secretory protein xP2 isoform X2 [Rhinolophus ferrumequinum]
MGGRKSGSPPIPKSALSHPLSYIPSAGVQPLGGYAVLTTAEPAPHPAPIPGVCGPAPNRKSASPRPTSPEVTAVPPHPAGAEVRRPASNPGSQPSPCPAGPEVSRPAPNPGSQRTQASPAASAGLRFREYLGSDSEPGPGGQRLDCTGLQGECKLLVSC